MKKFEVEVTSTEMIKPSAPTPNHLRCYQLSFLDQISPMVYNPVVLFYSFNQIDATTTPTISNLLKKSLSLALTHFYPLAGRIDRGKGFVDCTDDGVPFIETKVKNCKLAEVIHNPIPGELNNLLPFKLSNTTNIILGVQLNVFDCGGIAIGACLSHQISDALSFFKFLSSWSSIAAKNGNLPNPQFLSSKLFPPINTSGFDPNGHITTENVVCKLFVFDSSVVETLREKYAMENNNDDCEEKRPTRVEALSAFIWDRYVAVTRDHKSCYENKKRRMHVVIHTVNLRPKMEPPLSEDSFGNYYRVSMTVPSLDEEEKCYEFGKQMRDQIKKIDKEYVRKLQEGKEHLNFLKDSSQRLLMKGELVSFTFTSLCRFPLYDADFGWGKPTWVGLPALTFKNLVVFSDTETGGAIEAYVSLSMEDMAKFEADKEFLACVNKP
ncbi:hypothetical protein PIB30_004036 [Stylosanthes scabra]|uniref:Vinorine synthase-like n=1 Tax=Stylosanthes scabra TaxID=79078 RepID=A0ABU6Y304_9FABA|nr:hypothetical protein [Stylosanthes scabra]